MDLTPNVIAHRSKSTRGEMLVNPAAYSEFCRKARINDKASTPPLRRGRALHHTLGPSSSAHVVSSAAAHVT